MTFFSLFFRKIFLYFFRGQRSSGENCGFHLFQIQTVVSPSKLPCVLDPAEVEWHCSPVTVCDRCYSSSLKVEFRNDIMMIL